MYAFIFFRVKYLRNEVVIFSCRVHFGLAIALLVYLKQCFEIDTGIVFCIGVLIGSFLPDIDCPTSTFGRYNIFAWLGMMEHRGITHSIFSTVILGAAAYYLIREDFSIGFVYGYAMHLLGDSLTPMRLPCLLYPFKMGK